MGRWAPDLLFTLAALALALGCAGGVRAAQMEVLQTPRALIYYGPGDRVVAQEVARTFPEITAELEGYLGWTLGVRPAVVLVRERKVWERMGASTRIVGFAVPERNLVAIHFPPLLARVGALRLTLKHEVCHLLLHRRTGGGHLPRWLDEGLCQLLSDGTADMFLEPAGARLERAAMGGRLIPFRALARRFPGDPEALALAYEQSASFVAYLVERWGREGILVLLQRLRGPSGWEGAFMETAGKPLEALEEEWRLTLEGNETWFIVLGGYLYEVLFALMALLGVAGFVRLYLKRRARWKAWEQEED